MGTEIPLFEVQIVLFKRHFSSLLSAKEEKQE
jgi:hypothetical protein